MFALGVLAQPGVLVSRVRTPVRARSSVPRGLARAPVRHHVSLSKGRMPVSSGGGLPVCCLWWPRLHPTCRGSASGVTSQTTQALPLSEWGAGLAEVEVRSRQGSKGRGLGQGVEELRQPEQAQALRRALAAPAPGLHTGSRGAAPSASPRHPPPYHRRHRHRRRACPAPMQPGPCISTRAAYTPS